MVSLVNIAAGDVISIDFMGHERPLISINTMIDVMLLWKTLFIRYQLLLHLLEGSAFAKLQQ